MAAKSTGKDNKAHTFEYYAGMTCGGCKNAITRILSKRDDVSNVDADVEQKRVLVTTTASQTVIHDALNKWATAAKKELRFVKEVS